MSPQALSPARRYVIGVDGSAPSDAAIDWVRSRLRKAPLPVALVTVAPRATEDDREQADLLDRARRRLLAGTVAPGVTCHRVFGPVPVALTAFADPSDLLVIGTHKTGFLHGRALGTVGLQTVALAPCSVAVIPDAEMRFRRGVVAGIGDDPGVAAGVAEEATQEAIRSGGDLLLVRSDQATTGERAHRGRAIVAAVEAARAAGPHTVTSSRVTGRGAADTLLDASRDKALLVLGASARGEAPSSSVIHDVLLNLTAPVFVFRTVPLPTHRHAKDLRP